MNKIQRIVLLVTAAVVALMVIFPPYVVIVESGGKGVIVRDRIMAGRDFLFNLPTCERYGWDYPASVDINTLLVQIIGAVVVGGLVFLAKKGDS